MNQETPTSQIPAQPSPIVTPPRRKMPLISAFVSLLIIVLIIAGGFYLYSKFKEPILESLGRRVTTQEESDNPAEEYINSDYSFSLSYPDDVTLREDQEGFVFLQKNGPTQKEGTELYDGLSMTITPGRLSGLSIKEVVEDKIAELEKSGSVSITKEPELTSIGEKTAYIFEAQGLGQFRYIYLPIGPDNYVEIVDASQDPGDEGYRSMVDTIINSLDYKGPSLSS